jgi:hypothetical protein
MTDCHHLRGDGPVEFTIDVDEAALLRAVAHAFAELRAQRRAGADVGGADRTLTAAVERARDAGVAWGKIADALDTQRGNAYQRYRRRPRPSGGPPDR